MGFLYALDIKWFEQMILQDIDAFGLLVMLTFCLPQLLEDSPEIAQLGDLNVI